MNNTPQLSVIMPVYNAGSFLREAIASVLNQTFRDFELIIVNDGSTDDSPAVISSFSDPRIQVINQANQGLRSALNVGFSRARGEYIARMDQDDISLPERFAKQIAFLEFHAEHVLVGTTYAYIDEQGRVTGVFPALLEDEDLKRELFTKTPFGHGTVMLRAKALKQGGYEYSSQAIHMEDYDLWLRFSAAGKYANLPEILYLWRNSKTNTTNVHARLQQNNADALKMRLIVKPEQKKLVRWPGWSNFRQYHNEFQTVLGQRVEVRRHDAHCSLYLTLAWLFFRCGRVGKSFIAFSYAFLISPAYLMRAIGRRIGHKI